MPMVKGDFRFVSFVKRVTNSALLVVFAAVLYGCESEYIKKKDVDDQLEKITQALDSSWQQKDVAVEEFSKLQQFEYQVIRFNSKTSDSGLETKLNELGKQRWDCFHSERVAASDGAPELLLLCKRRPETLLKYIPRNWLSF